MAVTMIVLLYKLSSSLGIPEKLAPSTLFQVPTAFKPLIWSSFNEKKIF